MERQKAIENYKFTLNTANKLSVLCLPQNCAVLIDLSLVGTRNQSNEIFNKIDGICLIFNWLFLLYRQTLSVH